MNNLNVQEAKICTDALIKTKNTALVTEDTETVTESETNVEPKTMVRLIDKRAAIMVSKSN